MCARGTAFSLNGVETGLRSTGGPWKHDARCHKPAQKGKFCRTSLSCSPEQAGPETARGLPARHWERVGVGVSGGRVQFGRVGKFWRPIEGGYATT